MVLLIILYLLEGFYLQTISLRAKLVELLLFQNDSQELIFFYSSYLITT